MTTNSIESVRAFSLEFGCFSQAHLFFLFWLFDDFTVDLLSLLFLILYLGSVRLLYDAL